MGFFTFKTGISPIEASYEYVCSRKMPQLGDSIGFAPGNGAEVHTGLMPGVKKGALFSP